MRNIFILISLIGMTSLSARAQEVVELDGTNFAIFKIGSKLHLYPQKVKSSIQFAGGDVFDDFSNDCTSIRGVVRRNKRRIEECAEDRDNSRCRALEKRIRILAEGRATVDEPFGDFTNSSWILADADELDLNVERISGLAAKNFSVAKENIFVHETVTKALSAQIKQIITVKYDSESVIPLMMSILGISENDIVSIHSKKDELTSANRIFACEFQSGKVDLTLGVLNSFSVQDSIDPKRMHSIWKVYQYLVKNLMSKIDGLDLLTQSALVGYEIAQAYQAEEITPIAELDPKALFERIFFVDQEQVMMHRYSSELNLQDGLYPTITHDKDILLEWSTR